MFLIIATFKSNKTASEVESWLTKVAPVAASTSATIALAPSFPYLHLVTKGIKLAAQDVSPFPPGSYTGAVSADQLVDLNVKYCLVGHSERRRYFHETHSEIARKIRELVSVGITPVLCLSKEDITPQLAALDDKLQRECLFVYEPPEDIGGEETAPLADIKEVTSLLHSLVPDRPVLYGGSVNAGNLKGLVELGVDGVLVSTASLKASSFIDLLTAYAGLE